MCKSPTAAALRPTNLTIEAWVRFSSLNSPASGSSPAGEQYIVFKQNTASGNFEGFALTKTRVSGRDYFDFQVSSASGQAAEVTSVTTVSTGVWYHVAAVRGSNYLQLYVNGQLERQRNVSFPQSYGSYPLYFGTSGQTSWDHKFAGELDEVSLYNRALSSPEVAAIHAAGADGKCKAVAILAQPQNQTVAVGANVSFTVSASGSAPLSYQWQRNGMNLANNASISGVYSSALNLANVSLEDAADYRVVLANVAGVTTSAVAVLEVVPEMALPSITTQPASQTATAGTNVTFTVSAAGFGLSYQWLFNGTPLANGGKAIGAASSTLAISYLLPADSGAYSVVVTNSAGSVTSTPAILTVTPAVNCSAAPPGLVGWWPGDGNGNDIVGTNNGTFQGGATADAQAVVGKGFSLDGTNKYIRIPDSPALRPAELTVECWAKWNNLDVPGTSVYPGQQYLVFKQNSRATDFEAYVLSKDRTWNDIILWEVTSASGELVRIDSTSPVTTNVWYHLAGVRGSNYIQIYFNGRLEAQTNVNFPQDYGDWPLYFGTSGQSYYDRKLNGVMDEVALYNRALSADEIAALYATGAAGKCKGTNGILITAQPQSQSVLSGSNVSFSVTATAAAPMTYQWQFNGTPIPGATTSSFALSSVQATNVGSYQVVITNPTGTKTSADAILTVTAPPTITLQPTDQAVLAGATVDFSVAANGAAPLEYQWQLNGTNLAGAVNQTLSLTNVQPAQAGGYSVLVNNSAGSVTSAVALLTVAGPPLLLNARIATNGAFAFTLSGVAGLVYALEFTTNFQAWTFLTWLTNTTGQVDFIDTTSASVGLRFYRARPAYWTALTPPGLTKQPTNQTVPVGGTANFSATATGTAPLKYQWQFNGTSLNGASAETLVLTNVQTAHAGGYRVLVNNSAGSVTSAVAVLEVVPALTPPSITTQPASRTVTAGTNVAFTVAASGGGSLSYQWLFNGTGLANGGQVSGANSSTLSLSFVRLSNAGDYSVVVANAAGSVTSTPAILTVTPAATCGAAPPGLVGWWPGDGNGNDIVGTNNGTFQGGATADAQAVVGKGFSLDGTNKYIRIPDSPALRPAELTVECWAKWNNLDVPGTSVYPGQQYLVFKQNSRATDFEAYVLSKDRTWNDIILWEVTSASGELVRIDSTSPVTTNVWYHLAGVRGSNYIQIYFNGRLEAQTNVNFPQDYGDWPLYFGTSGQSYYDRKLNGVMDEVALYNRALSADEIAALYAMGAAGKCKGTNGVLITTQPQSQTAAAGSNAILSVGAGGLTPFTYQWQFNGTPLEGAVGSSLSLTNVQPAQAGGYSVLVANNAGLVTSEAALLTVAYRPLLLDARTTPEGAFGFTLSGAAGLVYEVEITTNFFDWEFLASVTNTTGQTDFTDTAVSNSVSRSYRARWAP